MKVVDFAGSELRFDRQQCDGFVLSEIGSFDELLQFRERWTSLDPATFPLFTLDDPQQTLYTAAHAGEGLGIHEVANDQDLSFLPPECFDENGEHLGYLSTTAEFPIRRANYLAAVDSATVEELHSCAAFLHDGNLEFLRAVNRKPELLLQLPSMQRSDSMVLMFRVPADRSFEALAALPNGYFDGDMTPRQMFALARCLATHHGYETFGVGASLVAFLRTEPASRSTIEALASELAPIFDQPEWDETTGPWIAEMASAGPLLILPYSGGMDWNAYRDSGMVLPG